MITIKSYDSALVLPSGHLDMVFDVRQFEKKGRPDQYQIIQNIADLVLNWESNAGNATIAIRETEDGILSNELVERLSWNTMAVAHTRV